MRGESSHLILATYNVHGCRGSDGRHEPARVARVLAELDADVIALQEMTYPDGIDLESRLPIVWPELRDYAFVLGPTFRSLGNHFGNVLMVRRPILELERLDLSVRRCEPRGAIDVTLDVGGGRLRIVATHLGLRFGERRCQVEQLLAHLSCDDATVVALMGDFNDWLPGRSNLRGLEERLGAGPRPRTYPAWFPLLALDRIWIRPRSSLVAAHAHRSRAARVASDHLPLVATLAMPTTSPSQRS